MNYYLVCPIGAISGRQELLTYEHGNTIEPGRIVKIPFGRQIKLGVVIDTATKPSFQTKVIIDTLDASVPSHLVALSQWISEYYAARLTTVLQIMLPRGIDKKRRLKEFSRPSVTRSQSSEPLTDEQKHAIETITSSSSTTHLLHGVTGSGKTRVYQDLAVNTLAQNKSVLVLVPEIALTPQLASAFESLHARVLVLHSGLTEAERHRNWDLLNNSDENWVIVGPRSALFSPIRNLGLIVVDECHEPSYTQDSQPKYSALRAARKLADLQHAKLVLGSATPLVNDYYLALATKTPIVRLTNPTKVRDTSVEIVDMREREQFGSHTLFSKKLLDAVNKSLAQNEQILLFHNRRGTARMSICSSCGWVAECPNCHIPLRLHHDQAGLLCHTCGHSQALPHVCPVCKNPEIEFKGFGSKRIEAEVRKLFPTSKVARFDSDTPEKEQLHHRYQDLYDNKIQIIIGTQGIAKGLDLPHLNTVGIVHADSELFIPDFSSIERSFQLTTQVIGRAGRSGAPSTVIIQTLNPEHPAIQYAKAQNYSDFYEYELKERQAEHMPPHTYLLHLTVGYSSQKSALNAAEKLKQAIQSNHPGIFVRGPSPAFHEHRGKLFYQQLIVSSSKRATLVEIAKNLPQRWQFTLDPLNLL